MNRSLVVLKVFQRSVEIGSHFDLSLEDIPRHPAAPIRDASEPGNGFAMIGDENLFPCGSAFHQPREAALGIVHVDDSGHVAILVKLARNSG